jgi:hypothetical protein
MDVLCAGLAAALREAVRGRADPEQARIAAPRSPDEWGEGRQARRACGTRPNGPTSTGVRRWLPDRGC